jgi:predicted GNAT family N-acyltransferase
MEIIKLEQNDLMKQDLTMLTNIIYDNFPELIDTPNVMHSPESIKRTLESKDVVLLLAMNKQKLVGYLLGEIMYLEDGRKVLFISYIFVAPSMRNNKLGKKLMFQSFEVGGDNFCDGIMLIYDTTDRQLRKFYGKLGFILDFNMRRYERQDVFYKILY